jgi:hypothetical protein
VGFAGAVPGDGQNHFCHASLRFHTPADTTQEGWLPSKSPAYTSGTASILFGVIPLTPHFTRALIAAGKSRSMNVVGVRAFVALNFVGGIGLLMVILTALLSPNVRRLPTWYNFCASWVVSCISYTLLTFGGQQTTPTPSYPLCSMQAALIYAVPPL